MARRSTSSLANKLLLDVEPLDDRLDDEVAVGQFLDRVDDQHPAADLGSRLGRAGSLLHGAVDHRLDEIARFLRRARLGIEQPHLGAALRRHLGDATPHGAGADDADLPTRSTLSHRL